MDIISDIIDKYIRNNEFLAGVIFSQFISNVPAAVLLSDFTSNWKDLIIGVNIGGLGTLIASMASLISYKFYVKEYESEKLKYVVKFTMMNILFLFIMILVFKIR